MKKQHKIKVLTRKEEIGIAAEKAFSGTSDDAQISERLGFILGAHWADNHPQISWISVKDKLPCDEKNLVTKYDDGEFELRTKNVIVLFADGRIDITYMFSFSPKDWLWNIGIEDEITHWLQIPEPPKK